MKKIVNKKGRKFLKKMVVFITTNLYFLADLTDNSIFIIFMKKHSS